MKRFSHLSFRWTLAALMLVLMLALPWAVLADNVVNDITVSPAVVTITAGDSTTVGYKIVATGGDSQPGCNASDGSSATVTPNVPAGVTKAPSSRTFSTCGDFQYVQFSSSTPGSYVISVSVSDTGTGTYHLTPATFTLIVNALSDTTPPTASPTQSPPANAAGWNNTDVTVTWNWTDNVGGSGIDPANCTTSSTSSGEGTIMLNATCKDLTGNTGNASYTVKVDKTPPTISGVASPAPNAAGWNNTNVSVSFTCNDSLSGVASCGPNQTLSSEGASQSAMGTAIDNAGNSASTTVSGINIDKTPPTMTWSNGPADGAIYYFGFVPAEPTCTASDSLSGPNGCIVTGYGTTVGSHTMTATAYDVAGNSKAETRSYEVKPWEMYGFYQPVDMTPAGQPTVWNTVKGGSTVPLKFEVFAGSLEFTDPSVIVQPLQASKVSCTTGSEDAIEELAAAGNTVLRYDFTDGQFIYNWKTPKSPGTCYKVTVSSMSGSSLTASFKLK